MQVKVLIVNESPNLCTGQGIVGKNIGQGLIDNGYNVVSLGWDDESCNKRVPWKVYATKKDDYYGAKIFDQVIMQERPDIVLTIGDTWNYGFVPQSQLRKYFQWVGYVAIDGEVHKGGIPPTWVPIIQDMDKIVTYTEYGKNAIAKSIPEEKDNIIVIPHGVDSNVFHPISDKEKLEIRKKHSIPEDCVIYLLVARNQYRKNIPEIFKAWEKFKADGKHSKAMFWPHMLFKDSFGYDLNEFTSICGVRSSLIFMESVAHARSNLDMISDIELNVLYNISDVVMLISGEGFGLPIIEAMACGKPLIVLDHSACGELVQNVGEAVKVDYFITGIHLTERPYPDLEDLVSKMSKLYYDDDLRKKYSKSSLEKSNQFLNAVVNKKWSKFLRSVVSPFSTEYKCETIV